MVLHVRVVQQRGIPVGECTQRGVKPWRTEVDMGNGVVGHLAVHDDTAEYLASQPIQIANDEHTHRLQHLQISYRLERICFDPTALNGNKHCVDIVSRN